MIQIEGLSKTYGSFSALRALDLHVERGSIHGFLGHNGAGKTTTLNILAGYTSYESGSVKISEMDLGQARKEIQRVIGYLPESPSFYEYMQAKELLIYLGRVRKWTRSASKARAEELLSLVGLEDAARRRAGGFSRGMKQRLGFACALVHDPDLLLLDEPTSALDPQGRRDVLALIDEMKSLGKTILISTHILTDVERVCDRVTMIKEGETVLDADIADVKRIQGAAAYRIDFPRPLNQREVAGLKGSDLIDDIRMDGQRGLISCHTEDPMLSLKLTRVLMDLNLPFEGMRRQERSLEDLYVERMNKDA